MTCAHYKHVSDKIMHWHWIHPACTAVINTTIFGYHNVIQFRGRNSCLCRKYSQTIILYILSQRTYTNDLLHILCRCQQKYYFSVLVPTSDAYIWNNSCLYGQTKLITLSACIEEGTCIYTKLHLQSSYHLWCYITMHHLSTMAYMQHPNN